MQALLRAGYAPELVAKITGHKDTRSLSHYDPGMSDWQKLDMEVVIALQGPVKRGEQIELPSIELKRRAAKVSAKFIGAVEMIDGYAFYSSILEISFPPFRPADKVARLEDPVNSDFQDDTDTPVVLPETDKIDQPLKSASLREDRNEMQDSDQDFLDAAPLPVSQLNTFPGNVSHSASLLTISNNSTQMQYTNIPQQSIVPNTSSSLATNCSRNYPVFQSSNLPPNYINTQLELHNHRLNMMETNLGQSSRISILESKMNQSHLRANFQLELPSVDAYLAQPLLSAGDNSPLLCHCGLEPRIDTVLAPGPTLGKMFFRCIQKGEQQCSFFQFKQSEIAQVSIINE